MQFIHSVLTFNEILTVSLLSWFVAQVLKTIINFVLLGRFQLERMWGDGGMPSAHSATVTAIDVYKRQPVSHADGPVLWLHPLRNELHFLPVRTVPALPLPFPRQQTAPPVSYTHRDVYKRQPLAPTGVSLGRH